MDKQEYKTIETYMLSCMNDAAHDPQHIYRVLYLALDIARFEQEVDLDILIAACLLHDIGRDEQFKDKGKDHAKVGARMAYDYLTSIGWPEDKAQHVADCVRAHRFRGKGRHRSMESTILYDADKLDATGALGIARTLIYQGQEDQPLYHVDGSHQLIYGEGDTRDSFFHEYLFKLRHVEGRLNTTRARDIAAGRREAAENFAHALKNDVQDAHQQGALLLASALRKFD